VNFWAGFFAGIVAAYAVSITAAVAICWPRNHATHPPVTTEDEPLSAEYPTIHFTHLTGLGSSVRGGDG
jgi:hypothetical protein